MLYTMSDLQPNLDHTAQRPRVVPQQPGHWGVVLRVIATKERPGWRRRYGFALIVSVAAIVLREAMNPVIGTGLPFLFAFPAIMLSAWYGRLGPGLVATLASALGALVILLDATSEYAVTAALLRLGIFSASGVLISLLCESLHRATRNAAREAAERGHAEQSLADAQHLAHIGSWELALDDLTDLDANELRWSDECYRIFGYAPGSVEVTNDLFFAAVHREDRASIVEAVAKALRDEAPYEIEHRILRPDGAERFVHEWATVVRDASGRPVRMLGTCQDITDRKRAESALRRREAELRLITDAVPALISYIDDGYRFQLVNRAYEHWFGLDPAEVQGRHVQELFGDTTWQAVKPYMDRALGGEVVSYEQEVFYRQGGSRWVHVTYNPDRDPTGHVRGFVALVTDIGDRKRAEVALRQAAERTERLRCLAAVLSEALTYEQVARAIVEHGVPAIEAVAGAVGMLSDDELALEVIDSIGYDESSRAIWQRFPISAHAPMAEAVRQKEPVFVSSSEERSRRYPELPSFLAGRPMGATASVPMILGDRVIGVLGLAWARSRAFTDDDKQFILTLARQCAQAMDRARLYSTAERARAQAESASRAKDEFLAMLGHELRNPLSPIVTALQLIRLRRGGTATKELEVIERQVQHLVRLVDDLLDISRITRGKIQLKRAPVELAAIIAKAVEMASPLFEQRRHRLRVDVPRLGLRVYADETRLAQVVANLLTNAAKYTDVGGEIYLRAARGGSDALVTVKDSGMGIDPELLPRVFDLFVQGRQSIDRGQGGLGLGLTLVRSLVELHGGTVEARSDGPGQGSEFTIRLPAIPELGAVTEETGASSSGPRGCSKSVLVVDDNVDAAELLGELLRRAGHRVMIAYDGPGALQAVEQRRADVAVLDIGLPVMDGYELAAKLRERFGEGAPHLIALTGYGQDHDRSRSLAAGFHEHLIKPVEPEKLLHAIAAAP